MPNITIYNTGSSSSNFQVSFDEQVTIGRSIDCDIVLDSESISNQHAVFERIGDTYQLRDLDSTNGIKHNGSFCDRIRFTKNEVILLGDINIEVQFSKQEQHILQPQTPRIVANTNQIAKKPNNLNLVATLILLGIIGVVYINQTGASEQISPKNSKTDPPIQNESATSKKPPTPSLKTTKSKTSIERPKPFASTIDPSAPPERLRIRLLKDEQDRTFVLDKMQTRRDDYQLLLIDADGESKQLNSDQERCYSGYCEEEPDSLVTAYIHSDGSLTANVFKAEQAKGTGVKTDWEITANKEFKLLTDAAKQPNGQELAGVNWVESNPRKHPLYNDNYTYDLGFEYQAPYIKNHSEDSAKGYEQMQFRADYSNAMFSLIGTRDLLLETKIAKIVIRRDNFDWVHIYKDWFKRFSDRPLDTIAFMDGNKGAGGFGYQKNQNHRGDFKVSKNGGAHPWIVFRHETGHYLGVGDMAGGAREGATIVNGNQLSRWSMPELTAIIEVDRAKHIASKLDKDAMVSIGKSKIQVPPYAYADEIYIAQNTTHTLDILSNDFDANGDQIALAEFEKTSASGGIIKLIKSNSGSRDSLEYTAPNNFSGLDRFSYSIVDKTGRIAYGNALIHINKPGLQAHWDFENITNAKEIPSRGDGKIVATQAKKKPQLNWTQTKIEETREWDVSKILTRAGKHTITLKFKNGDSAFITEGVALELNGKIISKDVHEGFAGFQHLSKNNIYHLTIKQDLKPEDKLLLKAKLKLGKNRENLKSNGIVLIESPTISNAGKFGSGLKLNGKEILGVPVWKLDSKSITIAAWVNSESWKGGVWGPRIIQMAGRGQAWRLNAEHGKMAFCLGDLATKKWNSEGLLTTELPPENQWVHIAAVSDGQTMKIYYDGKLVAEKKRVGPVEDSASTGAIGSGFKGTIDELYIFNKPLTQKEIKELMLKAGDGAK